MTEAPTVLMHWDKAGNFTWGATEGVRVVCVAENTPADRVYDTTGSVTQEWIDAVTDGEDPRAASGRLNT